MGQGQARQGPSENVGNVNTRLLPRVMHGWREVLSIVSDAAAGVEAREGRRGNKEEARSRCNAIELNEEYIPLQTKRMAQDLLAL